MAEPILTLDTLVERRTIRIDGQLYDLRSASEFSVLDYHQFGKKSARIEALMKEDRELSDDEVRDLEGLLAWTCGMVLMAPPDVLARLNASHRMAVLGAFTDLLRAEARPAGAKVAAPNPSTGENTSPA